MSNYNEKLAKLAGLVTAFFSEIANDTELKDGEKFLLMQRFFADTALAQKSFKEVEEEIKTWAKENLKDNGDKKSETKVFEGAEVLVLYSYPKPVIDGEKALTELERAYADLNLPLKKEEFFKEPTPRQTVKIQSILG